MGKRKQATQSARMDDTRPVQKVLKCHTFDVGLQYLPGDYRHDRVLYMGYGHIRKTREPSDGMALDCYVHPQAIAGNFDPCDRPIYAVTQLTPDGEFDETKLFLGWQYPEDVEMSYRLAMPGSMFGGVEEWPLSQIDEYRVDAFPLVKRKLRVGDVSVAVIHEPGDYRYPHWKPQRSPYGYIEGTYGKAADGKAYDVYIAPYYTPVDDETPNLYRAMQTTEEGLPDEDKWGIGYNSPSEFRDDLIYHAGHERFGYVVPVDWDDFEDEDEDLDEIAGVEADPEDEEDEEFEEEDEEDEEDSDRDYEVIDLDEVLAGR